MLPSIRNLASKIGRLPGTKKPVRGTEEKSQRRLHIDPLEERQLLSISAGMLDQQMINETVTQNGQYMEGTQAIAVDNDGDFVATWIALRLGARSIRERGDRSGYARTDARREHLRAVFHGRSATSLASGRGRCRRNTADSVCNVFDQIRRERGAEAAIHERERSLRGLRREHRGNGNARFRQQQRRCHQRKRDSNVPVRREPSPSRQRGETWKRQSARWARSSPTRPCRPSVPESI